MDFGWEKIILGYCSLYIFLIEYRTKVKCTKNIIPTMVEERYPIIFEMVDALRDVLPRMHNVMSDRNEEDSAL